jgi:hypothetical protein
MNDSVTQRVFGRSSANVRARLKNTPTCTGSTTTGPSDSRWARTTSKIGRSKSGPVAKYSSTVSAGAHTWDWPLLPKLRAHDGQVHVTRRFSRAR